MVIKLSSITSDKLKHGIYRKILPEYYELEKFTENNPWHLHQNVLDHVIGVFAGLEKVLMLDFVDSKTKFYITKYLNNKIGSFSRKELLIAATLLHDIAKTDTLVKNSTGFTTCPGHEVIGSVMVSDFSNRFNLNKQDEAQIKKIVLYHGFSHDLLTLILLKQNADKYQSILKKVVPDIYVELLFLTLADMLGSDLAKAIPEEFQKRKKLISILLNADHI